MPIHDSKINVAALNVGQYKSWSYTTRVSTRARRVRLTVSARNGLVIVIPQHSKLPDIPSLLEEYSQWIERALGKLSPTIEPTYPTSIKLKAIDEVWAVKYIKNEHSDITLDDSSVGILVANNFPEDIYAGAPHLNEWIKNKAKNTLSPWIEHMSRLHGLDYSRVTIRRQKTRWGSCSYKKSINLNQNLMFLNPELVTYVILHELVHTEIQDHSRIFWDTLRLYCPDSRQLYKELIRPNSDIPDWASEY